MRRLKSISTDEYDLEVGECDCGFHFGVDATYIEQVSDFIFTCPACHKQIRTQDIFPEDK